MKRICSLDENDSRERKKAAEWFRIVKRVVRRKSTQAEFRRCQQKRLRKADYDGKRAFVSATLWRCASLQPTLENRGFPYKAET